MSSPEGSQRIPLEAIDALVVLGGAQVTTQALDACVRRGVRVAALQMSGTVRFVVNGATGGNVHLRTALFRTAMDHDRSLALSKAIVAAKLQNSRSVVDRWSRDEKNKAEAEWLAERGAQIRERIARLNDADTLTMFEVSKAMRPESTSAQSVMSFRRAISSFQREPGARPGIPSTQCSDSATACS